MKTTIDVPEHLLNRAKITAAQSKTTFKGIVLRGLEFATRHEMPNPETKRNEFHDRQIGRPV